tara:strand:- start:589 stop:1434 length:846 start_codon:yes stop_codon:yes gene_type:complete
VILVTGAEGFIGSNVCNLINPSRLIKWDLEGGRKTLIKNIDDRVEAIIHMGAISSTQEANTAKLADLNILSSAELLEYATEKGIPFVYASSASVYGLGTRGFAESVEMNPMNYYAISKASFDMFVLQKIKDNPNCKVVGLRYFNVYGPGENNKGNMASPVHKFYEQAKDCGKIQIFEGSDKYRRDFISVQDVAEITLEAINFSQSGIYNVGTGITRSFLEVAEIIASLTKSDIEVIPFPENLVDKYQEFTKSDNSKLLSQHEHSFLSLEEGVQKFINMRHR